MWPDAVTTGGLVGFKSLYKDKFYFQHVKLLNSSQFLYVFALGTIRLCKKNNFFFSHKITLKNCYMV